MGVGASNVDVAVGVLLLTEAAVAAVLLKKGCLVHAPRVTRCDAEHSASHSLVLLLFLP